MQDPEQDCRVRTQPHVPHQSALPHYASARQFLESALRTTRLGSSKPDGPSVSRISLIFRTIPWITLLVQAIWSAAVMAIAYAISKGDSEKTSHTLTNAFWITDLNVSSTVLSGVGWALFVLLGFYISESSRRFATATTTWDNFSGHLVILLRAFIQSHSYCFWHHGDLDRIVAHISACPIALKMALRGERDRSQLEPILEPSDLDDVIAADSMYAHCLRVLRSYVITNESDNNLGFKPPVLGRGSGGIAFMSYDVIDSISFHANALLNIAHFSPAVGYVSHLYVFLVIWLFFIPLNLVAVSGWYVIHSNFHGRPTCSRWTRAARARAHLLIEMLTGSTSRFTSLPFLRTFKKFFFLILNTNLWH